VVVVIVVVVVVVAAAAAAAGLVRQNKIHLTFYVKAILRSVKKKVKLSL
jgi:hypothetical protein